MPSMDMIDKLWDRWDKFPLHKDNVPSIEDVRSSFLHCCIQLDLLLDI